MQNGMMNGDHMMMGWGGVFFGPLMMIGFIALIVFAVVVLFRVLSGSDLCLSGSEDSSRSNLKMQFAAGNIDALEHEDRKRQMQA
jgi:putative membrane protein